MIKNSMKISYLILVVCFIIPYVSHSQTKVDELKKKHFGQYIGKIPSYNYVVDTTTIEVDATPIEIDIKNNSIEMTVGKIQKRGSYHILFKGKKYYVIDAYFEKEVVAERIILNEKDKTLVREGIYPQVNAILKKQK